ncbi:MFS transporter [Cytobacillus kochii]|uniref:MFS transporter n=1 Tax=Cytobacillus kochii TaxID=859143 RepID=UPI00402A80C0
MHTLGGKLWTRQYIMALMLTFLFFLSLQSLLGGFPIYVTTLSNNPTYGGLMTTAFMIAAVISRLFLGLCLRYLNQKALLILSLIGMLLFISVTTFTNSIVLFTILRILQGIAFGFITTLLATITTNLIPDHRLGEGIGYFGLATSVGTTSGPFLAISMINVYSFESVLYFSLILIIVITIGSLALKTSQNINQQAVSKLSIVESAFDSRAFLPCFLVLLFYFTFAGVVNFIEGLGSSIGVGEQTSLFFLILVAMLIIIRPFSGKIFDRFGHAYLIYSATIAAFIGLLLIAFAKGVSTLFIAAVFYGIAYGVMQPTFQAWAVSLVPKEKRATANAMSLSFMDMGLAMGALLLGIAANEKGYGFMYILSSLLAVVIFLLYFVAHIRRKTKLTPLPSHNRKAS